MGGHLPEMGYTPKYYDDRLKFTLALHRNFNFGYICSMFLRSISIVLLSSLLLANFSSVFIYMGFEANQSYISKVLCENKDKPEMHCEGKCYLMKKLKQAHEKEQKQERQSQKQQIQDAVVTIPVTFKQYAFAETNIHIPFSMGMPQNIKNSIFHPPKGKLTVLFKDWILLS